MYVPFSSGKVGVRAHVSDAALEPPLILVLLQDTFYSSIVLVAHAATSFAASTSP